ncbi:MAG: peptide-methionine (S)-S-oxide reductase MsrA [Candidatus Heimdallarchaeota archaeon]|nr:peptide-methionine (S)-S-oxide reductase MsrA [Candidatus Heimdallarchaeota archaeon]MDH5646038.1 peptide-methionine (S)-S-oxide reductase MsrA [Candidatus Heimdallarchaeota archaeon]
MSTAYLGGGCFWCVEAVYVELIGVTSVISGYAGGMKENPTYEEVCSGKSGHAEIVKISFNADEIKFETIINIFLSIHDPTTLNRQGNDVGPQYRSIILYENEEQKQIVEKIINEFTEQKIWKNPIVTEVTPLDRFYEAEKYHQNYFVNNPNQPYCKFVVEPKVIKFRKQFSHLLKS